MTTRFTKTVLKRKNLSAFMRPNLAQRSKRTVGGIEIVGDQRFIRRVARSVRLLGKLGLLFRIC